MVIITVALLTRARRHHRSSLLSAALGLQVSVLTLGVATLVAWFLLPSVPVLRTFGYPDSVDDIQTTKQLLHYLQTMNRSLVRTTEVLYWFLFLFTFQFLSSLFAFARVFGKSATKHSDDNAGPD